MTLRNHPTPVLVPPAAAVEAVALPSLPSCLTRSADLPTSISDILTRLEEPPDLPADPKVTVTGGRVVQGPSTPPPAEAASPAAPAPARRWSPRARVRCRTTPYP